MSRPDWRSFVTGEGEVAYLISAYERMKEADAIAMDCDGTLVKISGSYDESIYVTTELIFLGLTGRRPDRVGLSEATFELRRSGGFNNDWDTVYAMVMGLLSGLSDRTLGEIAEGLEAVQERPLTLKGLLSAKCDAEDYDEAEVKEGLRDVVSYADESGWRSVDDGLEKLYNGRPKLEHLRRIKAVLCHPGPPGVSAIATVFDELYLGSDLYRATYGLSPGLSVSRGLIENESLIVRQDTMEYMRRRFPRGMGISTGRTIVAAEKTIGPLMREYFRDRRAMTFSDDLMEEYERRRSMGKDAWPGKPDPFSLERTMAGLSPFRRLIFVGDSMEDLKMCMRAKGYGDLVFFVGAYEHTIDPKGTAKSFMEAGASAVIPTINELRDLLEG
jgi:phosphoglycolate phosphatase-like HAD superfamily hydrolase